MLTRLPGKGSAVSGQDLPTVIEDDHMNASERILQVTDIIKKYRPAYEAILDFYSRVFLAQEKSREWIDPPAVEMDPDLLAVKQKNELPLIDPSEFRIDQSAAVELFSRICDLARDWAPHLADDATAMKTALDNQGLDPDLLFSAILNSQSEALGQMADDIGVSEAHLAMLAFLSMAPGIEACARQLCVYLEQMPEIKKGYCPVCGNAPDLAYLDQEGHRHLKCGFCSHTWAVNRMGCVFCGNADKKMQSYFFSEEEKEYRVNLCDHCRNYIKVVDLRQMVREFYPNLEMVSTLHLDMKAREKGYRGHAMPA